MVGIYKITNPKGEIYVGQSTNLEQREDNYRLLACKNQKKIYNSLIEYGWNNHSFNIIEECSVSLLNERERYWQTGCVTKGYSFKYIYPH